MDEYTGSINPPGMYVRALYDYDADDSTSLSFRQGDIIQVLTQLESGWWDGVINGTRGWFPSNYCSLIPGAEARRLDQGFDLTSMGRALDEADLEPDSDVDYERDTRIIRSQNVALDGSYQNGSNLASGTEDHEEAAFWIPQATPDGRLFYFNTLTGVSTMELPLESPSSTSETAPRATANAFAARQVSAPTAARGRVTAPEEDTDFDQSASEYEDDAFKPVSSARKRLSQLSNGASPATSVESLARTTNLRPSKNSFAKPERPHPAPNFLFDDTMGVPLTWDRMLEDMRRAIERYSQVVSLRERASYVRRAEDISDHLRLLLAAGSGTTDNHCGIPSIISSNKALYPHFRDMMSKFSKLVLNSHIASGDFAPNESHSRCLQDADGVLHGAYGFVDVARQQRGEEIPRLFPGFIAHSSTGGNWHNNGWPTHPMANPATGANDEYDLTTEPMMVLDDEIMSRMDVAKVAILDGLKKVDEKLVLPDHVITHSKHRRLSNSLSEAGEKLLTMYQPWMTTMEAVNLSLTRPELSVLPIADISMQKQRVYTYIAEMVISIQAVAAPLTDEWASHRSAPLDERLKRVHNIVDSLRVSTSQVNEILHQYLTAVSSGKFPMASNASSSQIALEGLSQVSTNNSRRSLLGDISAAVTNTSDPDQSVRGMYFGVNSENSKVQQFFGQVPVAPGQSQIADDVPHYLRLDHEGEVLYDTRTNPPLIKGGTLTGLVEQLTRHDRYDAPFKVTFLLTYSSFTTAAELFDHLFQRWKIQPPPDASEEEVKIWKEKKLGPIRFRVVNVLKSWFDTYWVESNDAASKELIHKVYSFARDTVASSGTPGAKPLMTVIEQRMKGEDHTAKRLIPNTSIDAPAPIMPKNINLRKFKMTDIDPIEFARQLTIVESRLYLKIKPHECLNKVWQEKVKPDEQDPAANIRSLILHSNRLTNWVAQMILRHSEPKKRAQVIKHFVQVADRCHALNNFSTLTSIISALGTAPIHRLHRTWKESSKATIATLEKLRKVMGSTKNFAEYREALHAANPPCIPFFGVYLTDLTFIEDGIPSKIKKTNMINFAKRTKAAEVIREIQTYQNAHYALKAVNEIQETILNAMRQASDVGDMYERSLEVEPREREDEKIARLLTESGFM